MHVHVHDKMADKKLTLKNAEETALLVGIHDKNLRLIRDEIPVQVVVRNGELVVAD